MPIPKPKQEESKSDFLTRCMGDSIMTEEYKDNAQRYAICQTQWTQMAKVKKQRYAETHSDYGDDVKANAKKGIELNEKNGNKCATQTGKVRAQQLANGEPVSVETIKRMYSYLSRAETYYDNAKSQNECGYISYLLWGGKSALSWSRNKLRELGQNFAKPAISFDYNDTLTTDKIQELAKSIINKGADVYIISAMHDKEPMIPMANELGIPLSHVYATGSNKAKVEKIKELGITKHYDNNKDVINQLGNIGELV